MKPIVEKEESGFYKFNITLATKRGFEIVKIGVAFGLATAWILAGFSALNQWLSYDIDPGQPGWIIIWCIVSATIVGVFVGLDDSKGGK